MKYNSICLHDWSFTVTTVYSQSLITVNFTCLFWLHSAQSLIRYIQNVGTWMCLHWVDGNVRQHRPWNESLDLPGLITLLPGSADWEEPALFVSAQLWEIRRLQPTHWIWTKAPAGHRHLRPHAQEARPPAPDSDWCRWQRAPGFRD